MDAICQASSTAEAVAQSLYQQKTRIRIKTRTLDDPRLRFRLMPHQAAAGDVSKKKSPRDSGRTTSEQCTSSQHLARPWSSANLSTFEVGPLVVRRRRCPGSKDGGKKNDLAKSLGSVNVSGECQFSLSCDAPTITKPPLRRAMEWAAYRGHAKTFMFTLIPPSLMSQVYAYAFECHVDTPPTSAKTPMVCVRGAACLMGFGLRGGRGWQGRSC